MWHRTKYKVLHLENVNEINDFQGVRIDKRLEKVNLINLDFGKYISKYYAHKTNVIINFPGGLIKKVVEAFEKQITKAGVFIIGDMAIDNPEGKILQDSPNGDPVYMKDYATSGKVAKFKVEDYGLAKIILESEGFSVELETVEDFIENAGYEIPLEVKDHFILSIREYRGL